jgi:hypothetical protein
MSVVELEAVHPAGILPLNQHSMQEYQPKIALIVLITSEATFRNRVSPD